MWTYDPIGETLRFLKELAILLVIGAAFASSQARFRNPARRWPVVGAIMFSLNNGRALERWFNR